MNRPGKRQEGGDRFGPGEERSVADQRTEVDQNYEAFREMLPELMKSSPGKWALLHHRQLIEVFDTSGEAVAAGEIKYPEGRFSIQEITTHPISLGWFSGVPA